MDAFIDYYIRERGKEGWYLVKRVYRAHLRSPYRVAFQSGFLDPSPGPRDEVEVALIASGAEEGVFEWNLTSPARGYGGDKDWRSLTASPDGAENDMAALWAPDPHSPTRRRYLELVQTWSGFPDPSTSDISTARRVNYLCVEARLTDSEPHPAYLLVFFRH